MLLLSLENLSWEQKYIKSVMPLSATAHIMDIGHILVSITSEYVTLSSVKKGFNP